VKHEFLWLAGIFLLVGAAWALSGYTALWLRALYAAVFLVAGFLTALSAASIVRSALIGLFIRYKASQRTVPEIVQSLVLVASALRRLDQPQRAPWEPGGGPSARSEHAIALARIVGELEWVASCIERYLPREFPGRHLATRTAITAGCNGAAAAVRVLASQALFPDAETYERLRKETHRRIRSAVRLEWGSWPVAAAESFSRESRFRAWLRGVQSFAVAVLPAVLLGAAWFSAHLRHSRLPFSDAVLGTFLTFAVAWFLAYASSWFDPRASEKASTAGTIAGMIRRPSP